MNETFLRERITALRVKKGVSETKMSTDMGHAKNYIRNITSGNSLPSVPELLFMFEYLGVTASQFFDEEVENPALIQKALEGMKQLSDSDLQMVVDMIDRLKNNNF